MYQCQSQSQPTQADLFTSGSSLCHANWTNLEIVTFMAGATNNHSPEHCGNYEKSVCFWTLEFTELILSIYFCENFRAIENVLLIHSEW